ncbi:MAG: DHHA1 domain-containing protein, partial [Bdellovibrionales bacterium]|jgi:phosphoesterase RecJ-like protein|nr:DHHA1 domain-containing protein [Bdellovibrionales bacterium]
MQTRFGAEPSDSGDVIDMALNVNSVKVALLLREEEKGSRWKVSLRSKRGFNIVHAAEALGGGGHQNAAGATVNGASAQILEEKLKPLLLQEIRSKMVP